MHNFRCSDCGYALEVPEALKCPECGLTASIMTQPSPRVLLVTTFGTAAYGGAVMLSGFRCLLALIVLVNNPDPVHLDRWLWLNVCVFLLLIAAGLLWGLRLVRCSMLLSARSPRLLVGGVLCAFVAFGVTSLVFYTFLI